MVKKSTGKLLVIVLIEVVSAAAILFALGLFCLCWRHRRRALRAAARGEEPLWMAFQDLGFQPWEVIRSIEEQKSEEGNLLGAGGFGHVYKATMSNGQTVAVKQLYVQADSHGDRDHDHNHRHYQGHEREKHGHQQGHQHNYNHNQGHQQQRHHSQQNQQQQHQYYHHHQDNHPLGHHQHHHDQHAKHQEHDYHHQKTSGILQDDHGFAAEIQTLGRIRHKNIVQLLCCYSNRSDLNLLVYEYMPKGSLKDALHGHRGDDDNGGALCPLDGLARYKIALGAAQGLAYLHHECNPPIVHRDIKSANILLDDNYEAHVADFGLARILQNHLHTTDIMGTPGYIAPEHCHYVRRVTEKSDVYSFGIVLLELVTGKEPLDPMIGKCASGNIVNWVNHKIQGNMVNNKVVDEILDPYLHACVSCLHDSCIDLHMQPMKRLLMIALQCTQALPHDRPTMRLVVELLAKDIDLESQVHLGCEIDTHSKSFSYVELSNVKL